MMVKSCSFFSRPNISHTATRDTGSSPVFGYLLMMIPSLTETVQGKKADGDSEMTFLMILTRCFGLLPSRPREKFQALGVLRRERNFIQISF